MTKEISARNKTISNEGIPGMDLRSSLPMKKNNIDNKKCSVLVRCFMDELFSPVSYNGQDQCVAIINKAPY